MCKSKLTPAWYFNGWFSHKFPIKYFEKKKFTKFIFSLLFMYLNISGYNNFIIQPSSFNAIIGIFYIKSRKEGSGEDIIIGFPRLNFLCLISLWTFSSYIFGFKLDKDYKKHDFRMFQGYCKPKKF